MIVGTALTPAKLEPGKNFGQLILDLTELECEIALAGAGFSRVSLSQYGQHAGLPQIAQVVHKVGRSSGDVGIDPEPSIQIKARFLDLWIKCRDQKLNTREPRGGRLAEPRAGAWPLRAALGPRGALGEERARSRTGRIPRSA